MIKRKLTVEDFKRFCLQEYDASLISKRNVTLTLRSWNLQTQEYEYTQAQEVRSVSNISKKLLMSPHRFINQVSPFPHFLYKNEKVQDAISQGKTFNQWFELYLKGNQEAFEQSVLMEKKYKLTNGFLKTLKVLDELNVELICGEKMLTDEYWYGYCDLLGWDWTAECPVIIELKTRNEKKFLNEHRFQVQVYEHLLHRMLDNKLFKAECLLIGCVRETGEVWVEKVKPREDVAAMMAVTKWLNNKE